jgi:SAM-dependent methyltransferase
MSNTPFKDHFSTHAAGYAAHRPRYPTALVEYLAEIAPSLHLALDCGCGTGQLSVRLASRFERVVATDASASQIANAEPHDRVEYRVAPAEKSGLPDGTVDLITVAQAAHWLDLDSFYGEVRRVARHDGVVALVTYGVLHVEGDEVGSTGRRNGVTSTRDTGRCPFRSKR